MALFSDTSSRERRLTVMIVSAICFLLILYMLIFPRSLGKEFGLVPTKVIPVVPTTADKLTPGGSFFRLGDVEGYWNPDLTLEYAQTARENFQEGQNKIAFYNPDLDNVEVRGASGTLFTLSAERYPYWIRGRLFTFDENRLGLSEYSDEGKQKWSKRFSSLITAVDAGKNLLTVGTLDGKVLFFDKDGKPKGNFIPGGSRLGVIYNLQLSPDETKLVVLAGVDPKRFILLEKGGNDFRPVFHKPLEEKSRKPTPVGFLDSGRWGYYDNGKGLALIDTKELKEIVLPFEGTLQDIEMNQKDGLLTLVTQNGTNSVLRVYSLAGAPVLQAPFQGRDLLLRRQNDNLILGNDNVLLVMERRME